MFPLTSEQFCLTDTLTITIEGVEYDTYNNEGLNKVSETGINDIESMEKSGRIQLSKEDLAIFAGGNVPERINNNNYTLI